MSEVNDLLSVEENFEFLLPLFRVVVLQFLVWELTLVLLDFLCLLELFEDKLKLLEHVCPGVDRELVVEGSRLGHACLATSKFAR